MPERPLGRRAGRGPARRAAGQRRQVGLPPLAAARRGQRRPARGARLRLERGHARDARGRARARRAGRRGAARRAHACTAPGCAGCASRTASSTCATPARCCGSSPGLLAGQPAGASRSTATPRSAAGRSIASPTRCGEMGADVEAANGLPPLLVAPAAADRHRVRAARRVGAGQELPAARRPAGRGADDRHRAARQPRPHRADAAGGRRARRAPPPAA